MLNIEKTHDSKANFVGKATSQSSSTIEWVLDSGASNHLLTIPDFSPNKIPDGSFLPAKSYEDDPFNPIVTLNNVVYITSVTCNLTSISKLTKTLSRVAHLFSFILCLTRLRHEEADWNE